MNRKTILGILLLVIISISGAQAVGGRYHDAKRAYKRGDLDRAVFLLADKLRDKPEHEKSAVLLETVLPEAYKKHQRVIRQARGRQDWRVLVEGYRAISKISSAIESLPATVGEGGHRYEVRDVAEELDEALVSAAEHHYREGRSLLEQGGGRRAADQFAAAMRYVSEYMDSRELGAESHYREGLELRRSGKYKAAARAFSATREFVSEYKDSSDLYDQCRTAATQWIAIFPFENLSGRDHLGALGDILSEQVLSKVMSRNPTFLEFVNREQMNVLLAERGEIEIGTVDSGSAASVAKLAGVDAFMFGKILTIDEHFPEEQVSDPETISHSRRDPDTGVNEVVRATYWEHTRYGYVEIRASFSVIDAHTGKVLMSRELRERGEDLVRWIMYEGDQWAIPHWVIERETPGGDRPLRTSQDLALEAVDLMSSTVAMEFLGMFQ